MKCNLKHLSYSNLNLFDTCPRCWYLKYVLGYKMPGSEAMDFGSSVHEAIEKYHKFKELPEPSYLGAMVQAYADTYKPEDFDIVEEFWEVPIVHPVEDKKLDIPLLLKIDRVWNEYIRDVKTSASRYKQEQVDGARQTILYAYAYRQKFGKNERGIGYDVIVKNKVPKLQTLDTFATDEAIAETLWWVWNTWEKIQAYPEPDYHTRGCRNIGLLP